MRQWDADTGRLLGELRTDPGEQAQFRDSICYSPDGRRVVVMSGHRAARQWDTTTGQPVGEPFARGDLSLYNAAYSPDGRRIVTAGEDRAARQWDAATGAPVGEPMRHNGPVRSAAYSADGARIVTASEDRTVRQWDADTCRPLGRPVRIEDESSHESFVAASYRSDGLRLLALTDRGTVRQWECAFPAALPPADLRALVEALAGLRFDDNGVLRPLGIKERLAQRAALRRRPAGADPAADSWDRLIRWAVLPPSERPSTPNSQLSLHALAARALDGNRPQDFLTASQLDPTMPLAHLALSFYAGDPALAEFMRGYELRQLRGPSADAPLPAEKQLLVPIPALEKAVAVPPGPHATLLALLVTTRWLANDQEGALRDCQRLLSADARYADAAQMGAVYEMAGGNRTALLAAIAETLRRHPELAPKPGK